MDFSDIRRITITALFSDDLLYERLVLKGGTALNLVYGLTDRTSVDLDFSLAADFEDLAEAKARMFRAIRAICQQMEAYPHKARRDARARDFYDIYTVIKACEIDLGSAENLELVRPSTSTLRSFWSRCGC